MPGSEYTAVGSGLKIKGGGIEKKKKKKKKLDASQPSASKAAGPSNAEDDVEEKTSDKPARKNPANEEGDEIADDYESFKRSGGKTEAELRHEERRKQRVCRFVDRCATPRILTLC
jgi:protein FAM32A